jgi:hypothetical protein
MRFLRKKAVTGSWSAALAKMQKKGDLPQKTCVTCGRPFSWRKKWAKVWDEVKYCSDRCRGERTKPARG